MVRLADYGIFDPLPNFRFEVAVDGIVVAHFQEISGLKMENEKIDYREGGDGDMVRPTPGLARSTDITLTRGRTENFFLEDWYNDVFSINGLSSLLPYPTYNYKKTVTIIPRKRGGIAVRPITIMRAWPMSYEPGDFNALGNEILIEKVVLANEGFFSSPASGPVPKPPSQLA